MTHNTRKRTITLTDDEARWLVRMWAQWRNHIRHEVYSDLYSEYDSFYDLISAIADKGDEESAWELRSMEGVGSDLFAILHDW